MPARCCGLSLDFTAIVPIIDNVKSRSLFAISGNIWECAIVMKSPPNRQLDPYATVYVI
ncbi:hypothetical protein [Hydrococcus rivularis]|uniref:hypothetical protein n=1 Tax=Hydrococcus rivularis TaxID=1616834 RepID=UPI001C317C8A|nr:hypothetical protein [Hydrococcus rivularis]